MAAKPAANENISAEPEQPKAPTIVDLIKQAQETELNTRVLEEEAREAERRLNRAKESAREAWDAIYLQLAAIKAEHGSSTAYRSSKLGKLLEGIR